MLAKYNTRQYLTKITSKSIKAKGKCDIIKIGKYWDITLMLYRQKYWVEKSKQTSTVSVTPSAWIKTKFTIWE